jgi:hypothetical protein
MITIPRLKFNPELIRGMMLAKVDGLVMNADLKDRVISELIKVKIKLVESKRVRGGFVSLHDGDWNTRRLIQIRLTVPWTLIDYDDQCYVIWHELAHVLEGMDMGVIEDHGVCWQGWMRELKCPITPTYRVSDESAERLEQAGYTVECG